MGDGAAVDPVDVVEEYVAATQLARQTQRDEDFEKLRRFLAEDVVIKLAGPWGDQPWRIASTSAEQMLRRLADPINRASSLTTENVNVVRAGADVLVEQLSTLTRDGRAHVSMVCHIFTVSDGRISMIRAYRNDAGIPRG